MVSDHADLEGSVLVQFQYQEGGRMMELHELMKVLEKCKNYRYGESLRLLLAE